MESALIGLFGVVVGSVLATIKDWWLHHYKLRTEARHLALMIAFALDRYIDGCASVAVDEGETNKEGYTNPQAKRPKFDAASVTGDWRSLPLGIVNDVFNLQLRAEAADAHIDFAFNEVATPPDFSEGFEVRQPSYAELGLQAFELANRLRRLASVPLRVEEDWPVGRLRAIKDKFNGSQVATEM
jgi:hypothetical protein